MSSTVLVFGTDDVLLTTRRLILEKMGFQVQTTGQISEAERILKERDLALLVLCSSANERDVAHLLETANTLKPGIKTIVIDRALPITPKAKVEVIDGFHGPEAFLTAVNRMFGYARA
jgi:DNA-binding NtrC family response regulator